MAVINLYKSALNSDYETIHAPSEKKICEVVKNIDFGNSLIYVNGFQRDENYVLQLNDICTIRQFPRNKDATNVVGWILDPIGSLITNGINGWTGNSGLTTIIDKTVENYMKDSLSSLSDNSSTSTSYSVESNPTISGCKNQQLVGHCFPFVMGRSYFTPYYIGKPYFTYEQQGKNLYYHCLYMLGYNDINVTDISLGLYKLASNTNKIRSGFIDIDGFYDKDKYEIKLEIQDSAEVSIYPCKVVQTDCNIELLSVYDSVEKTVQRLTLERFSARYPYKVGVTLLVTGQGFGDGSKNTEAIKLEYSLDGGETYTDMRIEGFTLGNYTYLDSDGKSVTTTANTRKDFSVKSLYYNAWLNLTYAQVQNMTNNTVEFRVRRLTYTSDSQEQSNINQGIFLTAITTWCYDPVKTASAKAIVPQTVISENDRKKTTRLGLTLKCDETLTDLKELNCIVQALGRTYDSTNGWSSTVSETCNPASMALLSLQSPMRGNETYTDDEIDLDAFGRFYEFCNDYDIKNAKGENVGFQCNGVVTKQVKGMTLFNSILNTARGYLNLSGNKYSVSIDKPQTIPVMILNNQNVLEADNAKDFDEEVHAIKAKFSNEDNYYQEDEMIVYDDGYSSSTENVETKEMSFDYQTNAEQIKKNARYELAKLRLRPETWTRKVASEGAIIEIGSLVTIQDDTIVEGIGDGAEVVSVIYDDESSPTKVLGIKTDGHFEVTDTTQDYGIKIMIADGQNAPSVITKKVTISEEGTYSDFTFAEPIEITDNLIPYEGDIVAFGLYEKISTDAICIGKEDDGEGKYTLSFVPYNEGIYTADSTNLPEFNSQVTLPQKKTSTPTPSFDKVISAVTGVTSPTGLPSLPINLTGTIYQDSIELTCVSDTSGLVNSIKYYTWEITKHDGSIVLYNSTNNYFSYIFDRTVDGYIGAESLNQWKIRVQSTNIYGTQSEWTDYSSLVFGISNYTWTPSKPIVSAPVADKDGFKVEWILSGSNLGTSKFKVKVYDGETLLYTSSIVTENYFDYKFDRAVDGYPEKSDFDNTRNLSNYKVVVIHSNDAYDFDSGVQSDETSLLLSDYGTWRIASFTTENISKDVIDRTVVLKLTTSDGSLKYYGTTKYKISIKRTGIDVTGEGSNYPSFTADTQWYKPDLYSDPLSGEDNYKTSEVDGYVTSEGVFTQTLPLVGQESKNIVNTIYAYKITAYNESGFESADVEISVTALCTSLRDIVKANADFKDLYVEKLSAISANIGLISQGGMGSFDDNGNYWALSKLKASDTGLSRDVHQGEFRVGDENSFIKVSYDENNSAEVSFKATGFTVTAVSTEFTRELQVKASDDALERTRITTSGIYFETRESTESDWVVKSQIDTEKVMSDSLSITNDITSNSIISPAGRFDNNLIIPCITPTTLDKGSIWISYD